MYLKLRPKDCRSLQLGGERENLKLACPPPSPRILFGRLAGAGQAYSEVILLPEPGFGSKICPGSCQPDSHPHKPCEPKKDARIPVSQLTFKAKHRNQSVGLLSVVFFLCTQDLGTQHLSRPRPG